METIISTILIGIGLSMDAFSFSIAYGSLGFSKKKVYLISLVVGIYHFLMPLIGLAVGKKILKYLIIDSKYIVFSLFIIIGIQMFKSVGKNDTHDKFNILGTLLFGLSVSMDSFTTGIGLEYITANYIVAVTIFMICSFLFTLVGLKFGKFLSNKLGKSSSILGGIIFVLLAFYYLIV